MTAKHMIEKIAKNPGQANDAALLKLAMVLHRKNSQNTDKTSHGAIIANPKTICMKVKVPAFLIISNVMPTL